MKNQKTLGIAMLLSTAMFWGFGFVSQSIASETIGTYTFNTLRFAVGGLALLAVRLIRRAPAARPASPNRLRAACVVGFILFAAGTLQQLGIKTAGAGKSGFITALYIVLVPVIGALRGARTPRAVWLAAPLAAVGLYLLCAPQGAFALSAGDALLIGCAVCYALHIIAVDHYAMQTDAITLSMGQFFVAAALSLPVSLVSDVWRAPDIAAAALPVLYSGIMSCAVAYTLQIAGQQRTPPAVASLLMSLESAFAVLGGALIQGVWPTPREAVGCAVMLCAVLLSQYSGEKRSKNARKDEGVD